MKVFIILLFTTSIFSIAFAKKRLRCFELSNDTTLPTTTTKAPTNVCSNAHEVFSECGANGCQSTCESPLLATYCKGMCIAGCVCEDGYIRDANNECVLPKNCPFKEPETTTTVSTICSKAHESYTDCGSLCGKTCENKDKDVLCPAMCVTGCFCDEGYVRADNGNCILPEQCPAIEPPIQTCSKAHEVYSECGANGCQSTCESPLLATYCKGMCIAGCVCEEGYIRDANNNCVLPEDCPSTAVETTTTVSTVCPKVHEFYTDCGSLCAKTCENKDKAIKCPAGCVSGCFCEAGYVRADNGNCIPPEQCPAIEPPIQACAKAHEAYTDCGTACPLTCENKDKVQACTMQCVSGCFCEAGYVRDASGECVLPEECPATEPVCKDAHEKYNSCGTKCPLTCENKDKPVPCVKMCVAGCFCEAGYVRNAKGKCIESSKCPKKGLQIE